MSQTPAPHAGGGAESDAGAAGDGRGRGLLEIGTRERRMTTGYEGRVILVTGANSGIGEAIAVAFQQTGATVFGLARRREALEAARARHPQIHWRRGDVTDAIKARTAVENAVGRPAGLDVVDKRRNAGVSMQTYTKALWQNEQTSPLSSQHK